MSEAPRTPGRRRNDNESVAWWMAAADGWVFTDGWMTAAASATSCRQRAAARRAVRERRLARGVRTAGTPLRSLDGTDRMDAKPKKHICKRK